MRVPPRRKALVASCLVALSASAALAHLERPSQFPSGQGSVPTYRASGPTLVVCKPDSLDRVATYPKDLRLQVEALYAECMAHGYRFQPCC